MELGFDHDAWPRSQESRGESSAVHGRLDWHGLRARFLAARAFGQIHGSGQGPVGELLDASFDRSAAQAVARFADGSQAVNLKDSADGKALSGIEENVAGASKRGDRGCV
jgi:hypothetical protein